MFGFVIFGQHQFGQGPGQGETPPAPAPVALPRPKGGGPSEGRALSRDETLRRQTEGRIRQDDEELIRMLGQLMDRIDR